MAFVSYNVVNDRKFDEAIKKAIAKTSDLRAPFRLIANDFYISQKAIFKLQSAGGYPDFKGPKIGERRNAPLDPSRETPTRKSIPIQFDNYTPYQYYKERATGFSRGYPLLKRTGELELSTTTSTHKNSILIIDKEEMEIGTDLPYASIHQNGGPIIPQRKIMFIGPESRLSDENGRFSLNGRQGRWLSIIDNFVLRQTQEALENGL